MLLLSNLKITGFFAPAGIFSVVASSLSRMSLVASAIGVPALNSRVMIEAFSRLFDEMCLRLLIPLRLFSRSFVTLVSMSSALAPG